MNDTAKTIGVILLTIAVSLGIVAIIDDCVKAYVASERKKNIEENTKRLAEYKIQVEEEEERRAIRDQKLGTPIPIMPRQKSPEKF